MSKGSRTSGFLLLAALAWTGFGVPAGALEVTNAANPVLRLPACFSSRMVLQQGQPLPLWGWAKAGSRLTVDWAGQTYATTADARGRWRVTLDAQPATAAPREMTIAVVDGERILLEDVLVGEVWLCSGQSNMYMPFARTFTTPADFAGDPLLRSFRIDYTRRLYDREWPDEQTDVTATWKSATSNSIASFSGVAFIFGRRLRQALQVPVGLITSTCGDSMAEGWTSMEALQANPANRDYLADWERSLADARRARDAGSTNPVETAALTTYQRPARLFNGMIAPLIPFSLRGVLWYQGEGNHRRVEPYGVVLHDLIADWRRRWGQEKLPFLSVQLPNSNIGTWPRLRQLQAAVADQLPDVHLAVTWDVGERLKIHPKNKRAVGERLALLALNRVYGRDTPCFSPVPTAAVREGHRVRVTFTNTYRGLIAGACLPPETEPLTPTQAAAWPGVPGAWIAAAAERVVTGFELAGEAGHYYPARAELAGDDVLLACEAVDEPCQVRFAWDPDPQANLYNRAGLPAAPFEHRLPRTAP